MTANDICKADKSSNFGQNKKLSLYKDKNLKKNLFK